MSRAQGKIGWYSALIGDCGTRWGEISVISLSVPSEGTSAGGVWLGSSGEASVSTGCVITDSAGSGLARVSSEGPVSHDTSCQGPRAEEEQSQTQ